MKLEKRKRYLQISFNNTLLEARNIIRKIPFSDQVLIEAGTPLIMKYGMDSLRSLYSYYSYFGIPKFIKPSINKSVFNIQLRELSWRAFLKDFQEIQKKRQSPASPEENVSILSPYLVADIKCADLSEKELNIVASTHASAATCLGVAPIETIDNFINGCKIRGLDSMIDMIGVENPLLVLNKLTNIPDVVIIHHGVDEIRQGKTNMPYYQIQAIKGNYDVLVAVAGGDMDDGFFNGADIVISWEPFYSYTQDTAALMKRFLKRVAR